MDMIERVADAIKANLFEDRSLNDVARAAIEAMREPTRAMVDAGTSADWVGENEGRAGRSIMPYTFEHFDGDRDVVDIKPGIWSAMIDAALKAPSPNKSNP